MVVELSVVVPADATNPGQRLLGSLDTQTLAPDRFEIVLLDRGLTDDQRAAAARLAGRRPNLRLVDPGAEWLDSLAGDLVLGARPDQKFFPAALERLLAFATEHQLDVVSGRAVQPRQALLPAFTQDHTDVSEADRPAALASTVLLSRRQRVRAGAGGVEVDADGARVGVLASYPAADEPTGPATSATSVTMSIGEASLSWEGPELVLTASGRVPSGGAADLSPILLARQIGTHLTFVLPAQGELSPGEGDAAVGWRASARWSPLGAAAGEPLPDGLWELDVVLSGPAGASPPATVRAPAPEPALLPGLAVTFGQSQIGTLQLDAGSTRFPLITSADATQALVTESARGSVLTLELPEINVQTQQPLTGLIGLGRLKLPATVETSSGTAVFTAFVSGLVGTAPIAAQFGRSGLKPTGLSLQISGTGQMTAVPTPPEAPAAPRPAAPAPAKKAPAKKAAAKKAPAKKAAATQSPIKPKPKPKPKPPATGPVARLRRAVPAPLEPLAKKLSGSPVAREAYRRLTGLKR